MKRPRKAPAAPSKPPSRPLAPLTPADLAQLAQALAECARGMETAARQWRQTPDATLESILTYALGTHLIATGLALNDFGERAQAHPFARALTTPNITPDARQKESRS